MARHWRALLFLGFRSPWNCRRERGNRAAQPRVWNPVSIRVEPNLFTANDWWAHAHEAAECALPYRLKSMKKDEALHPALTFKTSNRNGANGGRHEVSCNSETQRRLSLASAARVINEAACSQKGFGIGTGKAPTRTLLGLSPLPSREMASLRSDGIRHMD